MTRNALFLKLINQYLGQAFAEYSTGYNSVFHNPEVSDVQQIINDIENLTGHSEVSEQAKRIRKSLGCRSFGEYLMTEILKRTFRPGRKNFSPTSSRTYERQPMCHTHQDI